MNEGSPTSSPGSERLLESLWQDARREAGQNLAKAKVRADKLRTDIRAHRDQEIVTSLERAGEEAAPEIARILNSARTAVEEKILHGRYGFLQRCLEQARDHLNGSEETYEGARRAFETLFQQAASHFDGLDKVRITVFPADMEAAETALSGTPLKATIIQDPDTLGGVRIETADGSRVVDNTVATRLATLEEHPPVELLKLILPDTRAGTAPGG